MDPTSGGQPPRRRNSTTIFVALLAIGLLMLVVRMLVRPDVSVGELVVPVLGGLAMAAAIGFIVIRDRRDRAAMPPSRRDSQDQGMPD